MINIFRYSLNMSGLDKYDFTNSVSVISSTLSSLLACSICQTKLSSSSVWQSGQCNHSLCADCHSSISGHTCPGKVIEIVNPPCVVTFPFFCFSI